MATKRPDNIVPDYEHAPVPTPDEQPASSFQRHVCPLAALSIVIPIFASVYISSDHYFQTSQLDNFLGYGARGMFWVKVWLVSIPFILAIALAFWSFHLNSHLRRIHRLSGPLVGISLSILGLANSAYVIYDLYRGYF